MHLGRVPSTALCNGHNCFYRKDDMTLESFFDWKVVGEQPEERGTLVVRDKSGSSKDEDRLCNQYNLVCEYCCAPSSALPASSLFRRHTRP